MHAKNYYLLLYVTYSIIPYMMAEMKQVLGVGIYLLRSSMTWLMSFSQISASRVSVTLASMAVFSVVMLACYKQEKKNS